MSITVKSIILLVVLCCLGVAIFAQDQDRKFNRDHKDLVGQFLLGDKTAEYKLQQGGRNSITAIEDFLISCKSDKEKNIDKHLEDLGSAVYEEREMATLRLSILSSEMLPKLKEHMKASRDPEVTFRLKRIITAIDAQPKKRKQLRKILAALYQQSADSLFIEYQARLQKNLHDPRAREFFSTTSFDKIWPLVEKTKGGFKLTYLLLLKYLNVASKEAMEKLMEQNGMRVLSVARKTFWTVELLPLRLDGAYHWTTLASERDKNKAYNVIKLSIEKRYKTEKIYHFKHWKEYELSERGIEKKTDWDGRTQTSFTSWPPELQRKKKTQPKNPPDKR